MLAKVILTVLGAVVGFLIGLGILNVLLKNKTAAELRNNKELQKKYGPIGWAAVIAGGFAGYWLAKYM